MQIKIFKITLNDAEQGAEEMNKFLRSHRILQIERHFCPDDGGYWTVLAEYMQGDPIKDAPPAHRSDTEDVTREMSDEQKKLYTQFCAIRSRLAKELNIAHYLVFNNKELAALATFPNLSQETLTLVKGVNKKRLNSYGHFFIDRDNGEESWIPDGENSKSRESEGSVSQGSEGA